MCPPYIARRVRRCVHRRALVWAAYRDHWRATEDPGLKLAVFCTAPAIRNTVANFITEVIGTFMLLFGILAISANKVDLRSTGLGAFWVGLLVLAIGLSLGGPTGYAINPARDLGPRIMHAILPIPGKGPRTGATRGFRSSARSSAAHLARWRSTGAFPG